MTLTPENYFSPEANMAYMSVSQFKSFRRCEAATMAELRGEYAPPTSTALLVGSYVDAHFEGTLDIFKAQHPELFRRDGALKAEYQQANDIIARMESDELFMMLMSGQKQVIKTGEIAGVPFKIKIDSLLDVEQTEAIIKAFPETAGALSFCDGAIVDLKVMRDMQDIWSDEAGCRVPFAEAWGYQYQGAAYQAVEEHDLPFILAVGTKEATPNIAALIIPPEDLNAALHEIEDAAPIYQELKDGRREPKRCEHCEYCRTTRKLTKFIDYCEASQW